MFVAIEGCIASGKTTTANLIAKKLKWPLLLEKATSHPFLADFYKDPKRFAPETELVFALIHYHQLHRHSERSNLISDFSLAKDLIFARMNLSGEDLALFKRVYAHLAERTERPKLAIFLDVRVDELIRRIRKRGRRYEKRIPESYIRRLRKFYKCYLGELGEQVRVVKVEEGESQRAVFKRVWAVLSPSLQLVSRS